MVNFGDPHSPSPFVIVCSHNGTGTGKWLDDRTWVFDFEKDLPGAAQCEFSVRDFLRDLSGQPIKVEKYRFRTSGPDAEVLEPSPYGRIDERQEFILDFNAPLGPRALEGRAFCEVAGLSERIEAEVFQGEARKATLAKAETPDRETTQVFRCKRPLPNDAEVSLVLDQGIKARSGLSSVAKQSFDFQVRPAFRARVTCPRINARAACNPLTPINVYFTSAVSLKDANRVRLTSSDGRVLIPKISESESASSTVESLRFDGPFQEKSTFKLTLPPALKDEVGRDLVNAAQFPMTIRTDGYPPLAKFSSDFGVIESSNPVLPITLRNLDVDKTNLKLSTPGKYAFVRESGDKFVIDWLRHLNGVRYGRALPNPDPKKPPIKQPENSFSILDQVNAVTAFAVAKPGGGQEFEVVGIPLPGPGFYVVEVASPRLGEAYLGHKSSFHTHTAALVTNMVVHFKKGRESSLAWVTSLDSGKPVADAQVTVSDCNGKAKWQGKTDRQGRAQILEELGEPPYCRNWNGGWFVSARVKQDRTFTLTSWDNGIESWRFSLPTAKTWGPIIAHSVLDRSLLSQGETLEMKHFIRRRTGSGFGFLPQESLPNKLSITHAGSDQTYTQSVKFDSQGIAVSSWKIPNEARLGAYRITLSRDKAGRVPAESFESGEFEVAAFRLPTMRAQLNLTQIELINPRSVAVDIGIQYLSGGGASLQPVMLRHQVEPRTYSSDAFPDTRFANGNIKVGLIRDDGPEGEPEIASKPFAQKATLDAAGAARLTVSDLPEAGTLQTLRLELDYQDANGETQTVSRRETIWPAQHIPGVSIPEWNVRDKLRYRLTVIDTKGNAVPGARVESDIFTVKTYSHRKRLIGGFYAYENQREVKRVADGCSGVTDASGNLYCESRPPARGNLIIRVKTTDPAGRTVFANNEVWVTGDDDAWFPGSESDRMDVLAERPRYEPGQVARLQVKMPFQSATALVSVEREGVLDSFVVPLTSKDPTVEVPIKASYAPNVAVSVMVVRGRVGNPAATAQIDLAKPAYKLGVVGLRVGERGHALNVDVATPKSVYKVREQVPVTVKVSRQDGGNLPEGTEILVAAVDESLLELAPNSSWKLLDVMMSTRPWEVDTSTAQMQVVGKRHFGRKSLPPGGGGGKLPTRELFDTRVMWQARVKVDANGTAELKIPLKDSLSSFRIVAVAHAGVGFYGDGSTSIQTRQDLMLLSGLPPLVREGDKFEAGFTVRNGSTEVQRVSLTPTSLADGAPIQLDARSITLKPGEARQITWSVEVPASIQKLSWKLKAQSKLGSDEIAVSQQVLPAIPVKVVQATLLQVDKPVSMNISKPSGALVGRGGLTVNASASLAGDLAEMRDHMRSYPFTCTEQRVSRALALKDSKLWDDTISRLPAHLDDRGLLKYFASDYLKGDVVLTAYVLASANAAGREIPDQLRDTLLDGLSSYIEGRQTDGGLGFADQHLRRLIVIEALARYGKANPAMLDTVSSTPDGLPTSSLLDYISILSRVDRIPERDAKLNQATNQLRARMTLRGTSLTLSEDRRDNLWWLMVSPDLNAARALSVLQDIPEMQEDLPRLARGLMARQKFGKWDLTTANAWARIALDSFAARLEETPIAGVTQVELDGTARNVVWPKGGPVELPMPETQRELKISHKGDGKPWVTVTSRAAVPLKASFDNGYRIRQEVAPVMQAKPGAWSRGDLVRITLNVDAQADSNWVVVNAPLPAGATVMGSGLLRDSAMFASADNTGRGPSPTFVERTFESYRAYYDWVPKGALTLEYTIRVNNPGVFTLPPIRVEALYQPDKYGELPSPSWEVMP